jgi:DivIVA domain-containing protein
MFVIQRAFNRVRRGYDPEEVDRHLERVSRWFTSTDIGQALTHERTQLLLRERAVAEREAELARGVEGARLEAERRSKALGGVPMPKRGRPSGCWPRRARRERRSRTRRRESAPDSLTRRALTLRPRRSWSRRATRLRRSWPRRAPRASIRVRHAARSTRGAAAAARSARPRSALVPAHELGGREDVAGERPLELTSPGAEADVELGVESVQPEEVAVGAVPGRRTWAAPAARPEVVAPFGWGRLAPPSARRPPGRCSRRASA